MLDGTYYYILRYIMKSSDKIVSLTAFGCLPFCVLHCIKYLKGKYNLIEHLHKSILYLALITVGSNVSGAETQDNTLYKQTYLSVIFDVNYSVVQYER